MLSEQRLQALQEILREEYGEDLDLDTVAKIGQSLEGYFGILLQIKLRESKDKK